MTRVTPARLSVRDIRPSPVSAKAASPSKYSRSFHFLIAHHHRRQNIPPSVGTVNITGAQGRHLALKSPNWLRQEYRIQIQVKLEVTIVPAAALFAMGPMA